MCSVIGVFLLNKNLVGNTNLVEMVDSALCVLMTRGPDESVVESVNDKCVMGGNRLAIRSNIGEGGMPFRRGQNRCFYNGEIYNYRKWLSYSASDGEVILPLYEQEGVESFAMLDGEFALTIWDANQESLLLVRDPFGTKPLYFSLNNERLLWASSASAINAMEQHSICSRTLSPVSRHSTSVQEPYSSYSGIWSIPPGHFLKADASGVTLHCYHNWVEVAATAEDPAAAYAALEASLRSRLEHRDVVAIPMSGGIDSGIIAFTADKLKIKYHVFSVIEMFGSQTRETDTILRRLDRLKHPVDITLLKCDQLAYEQALEQMFLPNYYDYETYDHGNIPVHALFSAIKKHGLRVAIDGGGGDELFHGYKFRDEFGPVAEWPRTWKKANSFYSLYTTLLSWTAKSDRAGGYFSIETRFPYQNTTLMNEASRLRVNNTLKWPLRQFLLKRLNYGPSLPLDLDGKEGFGLRNALPASILTDMERAWRVARELEKPTTVLPKRFPFRIGSNRLHRIDQS